MNIVHLVVVKNSFLHFGIWKNHSSQLIQSEFGDQNLANIGTQQVNRCLMVSFQLDFKPSLDVFLGVNLPLVVLNLDISLECRKQ